MKVSRRLKAVIGNALVWGVAWFLAGFAIFTTILLIRQPQTAGWLDVLGMAIKFGVIGGVAGTAFSTFIAWRYRGRRLSEISWIKFGIGGGVVAGLATAGMPLPGLAAASDNTIRGGLTQKRIDVDGLIHVVDFRPSEPRILSPDGTDGAAPGRYEDLAAFMERPGELALDLLADGLTGMKLWPFDYCAHRPGGWDDWRSFRGMFDPGIRTLGGHRIAAADLDRALEPFRKIRDAAGDKMDIMVEGHGLWSLPAAKQIARALEPFRPAWLEDLTRADDLDALADLRRGTTCPILASEYLATRYEYRPLLEKQAADIVMIDPTWAGGITECKKICTLAEAYKRPVAMHDCTGPLTLYAGIHLAINATNAVYQESVRAYLRVTYPDLVTELPAVEAGHILAPTAPGLGTALLPDIRTRPGADVRVTRR